MDQIVDQIFDPIDLVFMATTELVNVTEALKSEDKEEWVKAMGEELGMLEKMGTWRMEELLEGRKAVGSRWVFMKKKDEKGNTVRFNTKVSERSWQPPPKTDGISHNTTSRTLT